MKTLLLTTLLVLTTARPQGNSDEVTVRFRSITGADDYSLPDQLTVNLEHNRRDLDLPVFLNLVKNEKIELMEFEVDGELVKPDFKDVAFYQDHKNHGVITANMIQIAGKPVRTLSGSFVKNGVSYEINPKKPDPETPEERRRDIDPDFDSHEHVVRQISDVTAKFSTIVPEIAESHTANVSSRAAKPYDVEMYWVADYQMWKEWKKITGHVGTYKFMEYFARQANGVDIVYKSFDRIGMTIDVWVLKVLINTQYKRLPTENSKIGRRTNPQNQNKQSIDSDKVLTLMDDYRKDQGWTWSKPDHLMMWTGYDLDGTTIGLAWVCGVCDRGHGSSTIEYVGDHAWTVAAHELGHNLGMEHDGGNGCPDRGNIMNPTVVQLDKVPSISETFKFSTCALNQAKRCLDGTDKRQFPRICLQSGTCNKEFTTAANYPGSGIDSPNAQCEVQFGQGAVNMQDCNPRNVPANICIRMVCLKDRYCHHGRASDGTPCGTNKWCIEAKCVSTWNKPTTVYKQCNRGSGLPKPRPGCKDTSYQCPMVRKNPGPNCKARYVQDVCCKTCTELGLIPV